MRRGGIKKGAGSVTKNYNKKRKQKIMSREGIKKVKDRTQNKTRNRNQDNTADKTKQKSTKTRTINKKRKY